MKKIRIFFGEKHLRDIYPHATKWQVIKFRIRKFISKLVKVVILLVIIILASLYIRWAYPTTVTQEVIKEVLVNHDVSYPVLERIAVCESNNKHYDKDGQVLLRGNSGNRASVDIGVMQINVMYHGKKATELGLDLTNEEDNREYAKYLYTTRGTVDWEASKHCWNK